MNAQTITDRQNETTCVSEDWRSKGKEFRRGRRNQHASRVRSPELCLSPVDLRQNCKYTRGKTGAAFRFGKTDHDQRTGFGNLIKISEQLDLIMVRTKDVSLQRVIVFTSGDPRIGVSGFVA